MTPEPMELLRIAVQVGVAAAEHIRELRPDGRVEVTLDIVPDDYEPHALLAACDAAGEEIARVRVAPNFKLNLASASAWIDDGFRKPG